MKKCKKCESRMVLVMGSDIYFCNKKECPYFELFPKGIEEYESGKSKLTFTVEVLFQPINKCWGVYLNKGNSNYAYVNENLTIAFAEMAHFIENKLWLKK